MYVPGPPHWIAPQYYVRHADVKSDAYKELRYEREAIIVVTPSTTVIPRSYVMPIGAQSFANLLVSKGFNVAFTYAKAVQPPTTNATGQPKANSFLIESIAVHGRAPGGAVRVAAVWETVHKGPRPTTRNTMGGWRTRMTNGRVEQHLPGLKATTDWIKENYES